MGATGPLFGWQALRDPGCPRQRASSPGPSACYLHLTVLPPLALTQLGLAGGTARNIASPHWPPAANGTSITMVPISGRFAWFTG